MKKKKIKVEALVKGKRYRFKRWGYGTGGLYIKEGTLVEYSRKEIEYRFRVVASHSLEFDYKIKLSAEEVEKCLEESEHGCLEASK